MNVNYAKCQKKKRLIVEQFQGNCLKASRKFGSSSRIFGIHEIKFPSMSRNYRVFPGKKNFQVSRFPEKFPDSRNNFGFVPKQRLLELSPPVSQNALNKDLEKAVTIAVKATAGNISKVF